MELDVTLGSTIVFLSPRQLHSFHAIFQALLLPTSEIKYFDCFKIAIRGKGKNLFSYCLSLKTKRTEKPMQPSDYRRIESELQQQIRQTTIVNAPGESLNRKGWSTGYLGLKVLILSVRIFLNIVNILSFR